MLCYHIFRRQDKVPSVEMLKCFIRANTENPCSSDSNPWVVKVLNIKLVLGSLNCATRHLTLSFLLYCFMQPIISKSFVSDFGNSSETKENQN